MACEIAAAGVSLVTHPLESIEQAALVSGQTPVALAVALPSGVARRLVQPVPRVRTDDATYTWK